jgi:hypothetical protein
MYNLIMTDTKIDMSEYALHISNLAAYHGVHIDWRVSTRGRSWRKTKRIRVNQITTMARYAIALHELGHILGPQSKNRINKEYQAWQWAIDNALLFDADCWAELRKCLRSYIVWAENRQYRANCRPVIPAQDHPIWALLPA